MIKTYLMCLLLITVSTMHLTAQSNEIIDTLLNQDQAEFDDTLYMVFTASGILPDSVSPANSFDEFTHLGWGLKGKEANDPVTAGELAFLIMKALNLRGGIMYTIFPNIRYAYKELVYRKTLETGTGSKRIVSGEEVLRVLAKTMEQEEQL